MPKQGFSKKPLPKSKRERKRYLLFEINSGAELDGSELWNALKNAFLSKYGQSGFAEINPRIVKFNPRKGLGIIKCRRGSEQRVRKAFAFLKKVKNSSVRARSLRCSGSLRSLKEIAGR